MKLYTLEGIETDDLNYRKYRFRSLVTSCIGSFNYNKDLAIKEGEQHQKIMIKIYPQLEEV